MRNKFNLLKLIQRKRHAAGFGVHSQFAYNLIKDTIHTPHSFYIYNDNRKKIRSARLKKEADLKYAKLLFRLINRFNAKDILEIGSGIGINTLYIVAHSKKTKVVCIEQDIEKIETANSLLMNNLENIVFKTELTAKENSIDAAIWDLKLFTPTSNNISDNMLEVIQKSIRTNGFIVVKQINKGKTNKEIWQKIMQFDRLTMSFDLGAIGIGFFKPSLPKLNYDLYF